jgi:hypothetical protein
MLVYKTRKRERYEGGIYPLSTFIIKIKIKNKGETYA